MRPDSNPFFNLLTAPALAVFLPACLLADWQDNIGYPLLKETLGPGLPSGAGIQVSQIEANASTSTVNLIYAPQGGSSTVNGSGNFSGKTLTIESGTTSASSHAATVAGYFFGNNTDPDAGVASIAPAVTSIHNYIAGHPATTTALLDQLGSGGAAPFVESSRVQSHAYVGRVSDTGGNAENDVLRRLDFAIDRDGYLAVAGMDNGSTSAVPYLIGAGFNTLSVGRTDGSHSHGTIQAGLDGQGRIKPELVTPASTTSWATGIVASAGAMLYQTLHDHFSVPAAQESLLIRAALLAGATKHEFAAWDRKQSRPLDNHFGLGELNVYHSHRILAGNEQNPGLVAPSGWDLEVIASSQTNSYTLVVPPGQFADHLSIVVTWNRHLQLISSGFPTNRGVFPLTLTDINLALKDSSGSILDQSGGTAYNYEHIYARHLPAGTYSFEVDSDSSESYALAWRSTPGSGPETKVLIDEVAATTTLTFTDLDRLATYHVQSSPALGSWNAEPTSTFSPSGSTASWNDPTPLGTTNKFYRLFWNIPSAPP
jgi:hypothetical protein